LKLYPHQETGVEWLRDRKSALLADEQGLGKTITALVAAKGAAKILVVCPTVVLWNWKAEAEKWAGCASVQVIAEGKTELDPLADVAVVTHGLLLRPWVLSQLAAEEWGVMIVDEAHAFKSPGAKRTSALYRALAPRAEKVWLLTGTPCPNNVGELWTHLKGLSPERLLSPKDKKPMSETVFVDRFCNWRETQYGRKITSNRKDNLPELKERLDGFILRRLKKDVLPDLPSIRFETVHLRPLKLDNALKAVEADVAPRLREALSGAKDATGVFDTLKDGEDFTKFRRLCGLAKVDPVIELLYSELVDGGLEKVVVFAHHKEVVERIRASLLRFGALAITGATPATKRAERVRRFQTDPSVRVMVANIVAGGVGVTLTAASDVVFAEQSWTPGDNAQAADRCHRIGQTRRVRVRFMTLADTIDEVITQSLRQKIRMIREVLGE
jgi:SWI/SNF-related matrix-associated actin-dependent regulator 1 of chromatin subfamily A